MLKTDPKKVRSPNFFCSFILVQWPNFLWKKTFPTSQSLKWTHSGITHTHISILYYVSTTKGRIPPSPRQFMKIKCFFFVVASKIGLSSLFWKIRARDVLNILNQYIIMIIIIIQIYYGKLVRGNLVRAICSNCTMIMQPSFLYI